MIRSGLINAGVLSVTICFILIAGELGFRLVDGYRLDRLPLELRTRAEGFSVDGLGYAKKLTLDKSFDIAWYETNPPEYDRSSTNRLPEDWVKAVANYKPSPGERAFVKNELTFLYNLNWLVEACKTGAHTNVIKYYKRYPGFVYAFKGPDASDQPAYRLAPRAWDQGYNNFGFRGPDISPRKGPRVIRLAFLGSSASANGWPFTYPEYVTHFLQLWADAKHFNVRFDVINGSRGGVDSLVIDKIMRYEVAALHPDIVVYYEGGNDLHAADVLPRRSFVAARSELDDQVNIHIRYLPLEEYSALMDRVYELLFRRGAPQAEPPKPPHKLTFDLTQKPDLSRDDLPFDLHRQVMDLRDMSRSAREIGAQFFLTSFVTLVRNGLLLDPERARYISQGLNHEYWPLTYKEIREAVDFQNGAYRELAHEEGDPFLDVDRYFPQDPNLFADMVHFNSQDGFRLQGWIMAQLLAPYMENAISSGSLPKPAYTPDARTISWVTAAPIKFNLSCLRE